MMNPRPRAGRRLLSLTLSLFLAVLSGASAGSGAPKLKVGDFPPEKLAWNVKLADYRGKIVIVTFWASWCGPCRKELPILQSIQKQATRDKVVVFAVNWEESHDQFRAIERALHDSGLTLISDESGTIAEKYDVNAIPHMNIIGRDGRIAAIHIGYGEGEIPVLVDEINELWRQDPQS